MAASILATSLRFPDHDWTFRIGNWLFGFRDFGYPTADETYVYLGPTNLCIPGCSVLQVIGVTGVVAAILVAVAVFFMTHRRGSQTGG